MPALSFFIDNQDLSLLLARLNADPEIAFIVPDVLPGAESAILHGASSWFRLALIPPSPSGPHSQRAENSAAEGLTVEGGASRTSPYRAFVHPARTHTVHGAGKEVCSCACR